jgi:hypothetical protein
MEAPSSATPALPVPLDPAAMEVVRLAAWIGAETPDDVFVSYSTLLLGLLHARLPERQEWQVEARRSLRVAEIAKGKGNLSRTDLQALAGRVAADTGRAWPQDRPLTSVSARRVLEGALRDSGTGTVTPADIMGNYIRAVPDAHRAQAAAWGLSGPDGQRIAALLPGGPDASATPAPSGTAMAADLPGYDASASIVLRLAFVLAGRRKEAQRAKAGQRPLLRSAGLMVAMTEAAPLLPPADADLATMLRGMLGDSYAAARDAAFAMPADLASAVAAAGDSFPPLSNGVQLILDDARLIATRTAANRPIGARHLLGALIALPDGTDRPSDALTRLRDAGADTDELRAAMTRIIRDRHPQDDHQAWQSLLIGGSVSMIAVARPDTIPDDPRKEDTLDLRRYADALGALIAARDQKPPLSIAVFGPWGSGKSFFMRMTAAAVRDFETAGKEASRKNEPTPFLGRIVQIEFNAWHYAEGNLWASLVHAMLVALERALQPADPEATPFELMLNRLQLREAEKIEAQARLQDAERRLVETQASLQEADRQLDSRRAEEGRLPSAADVLLAVQAEALARIGPPEGQANPETWIRSVGDSVGKAATYLGRPELAAQLPALTGAATDVTKATAALQTQVGAVRELLDEAKASADRGLGLLGWIANVRLIDDTVVLRLLVGGIAFVLLLVVAQEIAWRGADIAAAMTSVAALIGTGSAAIATIAATAKRHMADASRAFAVLGSIRDRVEARQAQRLSEHEAALLAARRATSEAEAEAARRRAEFQAAQAAVDKAREEVRQSVSAERLKRFVAQRLAEGDYQRHLGLVHTIRTDLERLQDILKEVHPREKDFAEQAPVERIVLYIDDLDRCPPARVVEVLEAVHLLLAFKLFVVVVGVDVRWVTQALHERYPKQLGEEPGIASPFDYMEKVFQIPFWLPVMDAVAGRRLLEASVGPAPGDDRVATEGAGARTTAGTGDAARLEPADTDGGAGDAPPVDDPGPATPAAPPVEPRAVAEALVLGHREREQLLTMAGAIGASPRRAKRFANLYRLLKASLSPAERRGFALDGGRAGSYTAALFLLALSTGAPRATAALIAPLLSPPGESPGDYLETGLAAAEASAPPEEIATVRAAGAMLRAVADQAGLAKDMHFWASRVTRFNFDGRAPLPRRPDAGVPPAPVLAPPSPKPARRKAKAEG